MARQSAGARYRTSIRFLYAQAADSYTVMSYIDELVSALGKEKVLLDPSERFVYGADWSPRTPDEFVPPDVVVLPRTTRDVQRMI